MLKLSKVPTAEKILCMIGFVIKSIERIAANVRYLWYYVKIEGAVEILDESCDERNIVSLQNKINKFRALPVLGNNRLHKKLANWLSTCFKKTAV